MHYRVCVATALLLISSCTGATAAADALDLKGLYKQSKTGEYVEAYQEDLTQAEQLFYRTLTETWSTELRLAWSSLGFEFFEYQERGETFAVLREEEHLRLGRGFYVFRKNLAESKLLQVPHGYSDLYTGTLGVRLMLEGGFRVAAWNTVPRAESDLAHTKASYFDALTRAFGSLSSVAATIQIHGFAQAKRGSLAGQQADIIVSNGTKSANDAVHKLDACLTRGTDYTIYTYSHEVQELGGTTNEQGRALRQLGNHGFLHVEMSYPFRESAARSKALLTALSACLTGA